MLNLLRFRDVADYSATPELAPDAPISGRDTYRRYEEHTLPFLGEVGGEVVFLGTGGAPMIGPLDERWDLVLLDRLPSIAVSSESGGLSRPTSVPAPARPGPRRPRGPRVLDREFH